MSVQHGAAKALGQLAVKMTSAFSGQGAVERSHKSIHRDRYSNLKQPGSVKAMCDFKASQIFKRNKESKSKRNVLQMIKDVFDEMAADRAEREETARTIASARAQAAAGISGDDDDENLDAVDADEDRRLSLGNCILLLINLPRCTINFSFFCKGAYYQLIVGSSLHSSKAPYSPYSPPYSHPQLHAPSQVQQRWGRNRHREYPRFRGRRGSPTAIAGKSPIYSP